MRKLYINIYLKFLSSSIKPMKISQTIQNFFNFTDGVRILMLIHRKKEGCNDKNRHCIKRISRDEDQFEEILKEFQEIKRQNPKIPYRIYATVNSIDIKKAIRIFKQNQVNADYEQDKNFYFDLKNRFISALMQPQSRAEKNFLIDLDTKDKTEVEKLNQILVNSVGRNVFKYETKNGYHFVTQPFDVRTVEGYDCKKDGLLLIDY